MYILCATIPVGNAKIQRAQSYKYEKQGGLPGRHRRVDQSGISTAISKANDFLARCISPAISKATPLLHRRAGEAQPFINKEKKREALLDDTAVSTRTVK